MSEERFNPGEIAGECIRRIKTRGVDGYEVYLSQSFSTSVEVRNGELESFKRAQSVGIALRILKGQKLGFSYLSIPDSSEITRMIDAAIDGAANLPDDRFSGFPNPPAELPSIPVIHDGRIGSISAQERIDKAMAMEAAAVAFDPKRVKRVGKVVYEDAEGMVTILNSEGVEAEYASSIFMGSVMAVAEEGPESETGWDFDFQRRFEELDVVRIGREAAGKARDKLGGRPIKTAFYPALIRNLVASEFLSILAPSFTVENVRKGKSMIGQKVGSRVFSSTLSMYDDGLHPQGMATSPFDGEGVQRQRTPVVISGRITGFLSDFYWARREGGQSTGNSTREERKAPPSLGISNLYIEGGKRQFNDLLRDLHKGVVIEEVMGLHTANPISGDFSLGATGFWVENGRPVHPVKGIAISGNVLTLFQNIEEAGADLRFTGKLGSPSLRTGKLPVSGE